MKFSSYSKDDNCYTFVGENDLKLIIPISNVILIDDNSGLLSIKLTATRKTIGLVPKGE